MEGSCKAYQPIWIAGVALVGFWCLPAVAQEPATNNPPRSQVSPLPETIRQILNRGADLYNRGDHNGCYRLFEGALLAIAPQIDPNSETQKSIKKALEQAEHESSLARRAFTLRTVLIQIRGQLGGGARRTDQSAASGLPGGGEPRPAPETRDRLGPSPTTLWSRLGGEAAVVKVVDDFVVAAGSDPKVNFSRNGKYKLEPDNIARIKKGLVDFVSSISGGPRSYSGKGMKELHRGMAITDAEFDAAVADLRDALEKNALKPAEIQAVLQAVEGTRKDVVEAKSPRAPGNDLEPPSDP